ncbi:hypothetical protein ACFRCG_03940 [Embleya sp. NPDC056575]|uniref:hypothetical protein n=1 Tax=unclassified Embleya TaxID=2699296 RepID=UPI0036B6A157
MSRSKLRSVLLGLGTAAAMLATTQATAVATETSAPTTVSPATSYSCTVPPGYTYTAATLVTFCGGTALSPYYTIELPSTGLWACLVPPGFTYTQTTKVTWCDPHGRMTNQYRLLKL